MNTSKDAGVRLRKPDRSQVTMRMECDDQLVAPHHPVRVVWDFVRQLDRSAFEKAIKAREGRCGRDATDPALMIALWMYASIRGVGSARELARLCKESRPYQWLCGGVSVNHHTLADFRVDHGEALDQLFTQSLAILVKKGLVKVRRISQDGTRVRASAGTGSFRGKERLEELLVQAKKHVADLRTLLDDPEKSARLSARQRSAQRRAAREKAQRVEEAAAMVQRMEMRQEETANKAGSQRRKPPRASTTDPEARIMKMPDNGWRPAMNVQLAVDTQSRAIVGVDVCNAGSDKCQAPPLRRQVQQRTGLKVQEHLMDGGYLVLDEIDEAAAQGVRLFIPPPAPRDPAKAGIQYQPKPEDSPAQSIWRRRMGSEEGKAVYQERASTVETANGDLKTHRGLGPLTVRGLAKAKCVALWCALAYNLVHFGSALLMR